MAKRINVDIEEIEEIIELYVKENGGIIQELKFKSISNFNNKIANNNDYKRKNGELFNLYKYNFWGGSYNGEYNYGKKRILEYNSNIEIKVVGEEFSNGTNDILNLVNNLHKKPQELIKCLVKIYDKERTLLEDTKKALEKEQTINKELQEQLKNYENGITNLIIQSQSPNNSLRNMLNLEKSADAICYDELKNMFNNNNERFKELISQQDNTKENVISMDKLNKARRKSLLEDEGF